MSYTTNERVRTYVATTKLKCKIQEWKKSAADIALLYRGYYYFLAKMHLSKFSAKFICMVRY